MNVGIGIADLDFFDQIEYSESSERTSEVGRGDESLSQDPSVGERSAVSGEGPRQEGHHRTSDTSRSNVNVSSDEVVSLHEEVEA